MAREGIYTQAHFADFGDYADYLQRRSAQTEVQKLDGSEFSASLKAFSTPEFSVSLTHTTAPLIRRGAHPDGVWAFGLARRRPMPMHWCGYEASTPAELGVFPKQEFVCITRSNLDAYGITFTDAYLEQVADDQEVDLTAKLKRASYGRVIHLDETAAKRLEQMAEDLLTDAGNPERSSGANEIACEIIGYFSDQAVVSRPASKARKCAYDRAREYMQAYAHEELSIRDICRNTSMSARTLTYAFKEHAGMSPMRYLKAYRLNKFRQALRTASPQHAQVSSLANAWGFWHLGKLAADYRAVFGVTPVEDLRKPSLKW